jgi:hypothetical protein
MEAAAVEPSMMEPAAMEPAAGPTLEAAPVPPACRGRSGGREGQHPHERETSGSSSWPAPSRRTSWLRGKSAVVTRAREHPSQLLHCNAPDRAVDPDGAGCLRARVRGARGRRSVLRRGRSARLDRRRGRSGTRPAHHRRQWHRCRRLRRAGVQASGRAGDPSKSFPRPASIGRARWNPRPGARATLVGRRRAGW